MTMLPLCPLVVCAALVPATGCYLGLAGGATTPLTGPATDGKRVRASSDIAVGFGHADDGGAYPVASARGTNRSPSTW